MVRVKEFCGTAIEMWCDYQHNWIVHYEEYADCYGELATSIEDNAKRVYGKNWGVKK